MGKILDLKGKGHSAPERLRMAQNNQQQDFADRVRTQEGDIVDVCWGLIRGRQSIGLILKSGQIIEFAADGYILICSTRTGIQAEMHLEPQKVRAMPVPGVCPCGGVFGADTDQFDECCECRAYDQCEEIYLQPRKDDIGRSIDYEDI